ncbi:MAG: hypothetical protein ABIJ35_05680 [Acidobacteriota bacterium]|nr:hypothetical protein [Acidobacteriota bacterium]MBU4495429.1 hypothetical protein [Acidobacteriota bacterium]
MKPKEKYEPKSFWKKKKKDSKDNAVAGSKPVKKKSKGGKKKPQPKLNFPSKRGARKK